MRIPSSKPLPPQTATASTPSTDNVLKSRHETLKTRHDTLKTRHDTLKTRHDATQDSFESVLKTRH